MPYHALDLATIKSRLEKANLAGFIYQHQQHMLVLQQPLNDDGTPLSFYIQHEVTADQLGLQFALRLTEQGLEFVLGVTHSNQNPQYEIGAGNLRGDQKAFNLLYAFYNYPKAFYTVSCDLSIHSQGLEDALETQLFSRPELAFLDHAIKTNPMGEQVKWMKAYMLQQVLDMKVRIQTSLL
ncbi:hypothetical protein A3K93_03545 [Acinetobacter sp. NCu2D-2]|uniref:hypothetical protein n=1 Tax=Acinetobacter sp. NCu2D-2 TaxID=1608473 RepID=UPI0007CE0C3F|nr:hypothetical protein [Acinetobacter sp. NCu2D-2]ANF81356.1 hypothetical protein A3K93_03545 [Acinetobacter sp. NCu2D-2]